ncbi:MAG: sel1 repeat family protein [Alphaproteobacteria bacterium]|nr:sel1 repeat family protein [Alphaproteobacteria bacterium]
MKKLLFLSFILTAWTASAQNLFWSFNDEQQPMTIAPECDARFDEVRGGVFMPSVEDVYQYGNIFLENQSYEIKRQAPYCFLVAALNGNADAQFKLAQLYNKGDILPQDDLSAYKWAFISALNGNKEAEKFTLSLEQFLTTSDLEATGSAIQTARLQIQENMKKQLDALQQEKIQLDAPKTDSEETANPTSKFGRRAPLPTPVTQIFSEKDRF